MYQENAPALENEPESIESQVFNVFEQTAEKIDDIACYTEAVAAENDFREEIRKFAIDHPEETDFTPKAGHASIVHRQWVIAGRRSLVAEERMQLMSEAADKKLGELLVGKLVQIQEKNDEEDLLIIGKVEKVSAFVGSLTIRNETKELQDVYVFDESEGGKRQRAIDLTVIDE